MFFALWQDHLNNSIPKKKQLEISLAVYFAIYPLLTNQDSKKIHAMENFKKFLESKREWAQEPDFLQYYALPYLPDPKSHPSFTSLFDTKWKHDLESDLKLFLKENLSLQETELLKAFKTLRRPKTPISPKKVQDPNSMLLTRDFLALKQDLKDSTKREHDLLSKLKFLRADYQKLISVSTELVSTLIASINNEKIDPFYLGEIVKRLSSLKTKSQDPIVSIPPVKT
jgi:hypothetical protein